MDLCAEMLTTSWPSDAKWLIEQQRPNYCSIIGRLPMIGRGKTAHNVDRLLNRWWNYPRFVAQQSKHYDLFHVVDHSYGHFVHALPANRTGVYCHDIDAFRCLTQPAVEPRPWWFRKMARRILTGVQSAAVIFYSTKAVHAEMLRFGLFDQTKLVHAPYGVDQLFTSTKNNTASPVELGCFSDGPCLLHVGGTTPRKRIDVLLQVFAAAREKFPQLKLCKLGNAWLPEQLTQIDRLNLKQSIVHLGMVSKSLLVSAYQCTSAVLVTSDAEGFGLPLIEAMACGAPVIASDIAVLRESGGTGAVFAPVGDIDAWVDAVSKVLSNDSNLPTRDARLAWSSKFSWAEHARIIAESYQKLL